MRSQDIIVVGAGVIGAVSAWRLAAEGAAVAMIDDPDAAPASDVAAGMLAPVTEAEFGEESLLELNLASSNMYGAFVKELSAAAGHDLGYRRCGTLMVARDRDDKSVLDEIYRYQQRLGLDATPMRSHEVRDMEPVLSPRIRGGIWVGGDHQIDPPAVVAAAITAGRGAGVTRVSDRVVNIEPGSDEVRVRTESGAEVSCGTVVVAAGSYSGAIGGVAGGPVPIRPVKGQLVHLRGRGNAPLPQANLRGLDVYIVTRSDGRVVVGATVEEQGFDQTLNAGAVHDLLRDAYELWPGIVELEFVGVTAGLRPATPDNAPAIGRVGERTIIATGHYRNGVLLAPITAAAVVELARGRTPEGLEAFDPRRFASDRVAP